MGGGRKRSCELLLDGVDLVNGHLAGLTRGRLGLRRLGAAGRLRWRHRLPFRFLAEMALSLRHPHCGGRCPPENLTDDGQRHPLLQQSRAAGAPQIVPASFHVGPLFALGGLPGVFARSYRRQWVRGRGVSRERVPSRPSPRGSKVSTEAFGNASATEQSP